MYDRLNPKEKFDLSKNFFHGRLNQNFVRKTVFTTFSQLFHINFTTNSKW